MKYRIFRLKVGRWRLVLANCRLKKMNPSMAYRSKTLCQAVANTKRRRYKQNGGCCELCGKHIDIDDAEMHHILPFSEFPQYGMNPSNLELVCDECHHSIHRNPYVNLQRMEQKADELGFNLSEYYQGKS